MKLNDFTHSLRTQFESIKDKIFSTPTEMINSSSKLPHISPEGNQPGTIHLQQNNIGRTPSNTLNLRNLSPTLYTPEPRIKGFHFKKMSHLNRQANVVAVHIQSNSLFSKNRTDFYHTEKDGVLHARATKNQGESLLLNTNKMKESIEPVIIKTQLPDAKTLTTTIDLSSVPANSFIKITLNKKPVSAENAFDFSIGTMEIKTLNIHKPRPELVQKFVPGPDKKVRFEQNITENKIEKKHDKKTFNQFEIPSTDKWVKDIEEALKAIKKPE